MLRGQSSRGDRGRVQGRVGAEQQLSRVGRAGRRLQLQSEEAKALTPLSCIVPCAQGQSEGRRIMYGEGTGEKKVGERVLAEAKAVFPVCPFICLSTRIDS